MKPDHYQAIVVGGGFFGTTVALALHEHLPNVLLLEAESDLLTRASYANQARVHNGYHYPRSILTALRSRINFPRFVEAYEGCIYKSFFKYYAVSKVFSNVTAAQFKTFCDRIKAPAEPAPNDIKKLFNPNLIEEVFAVQEYAFDSTKLRRMVKELLAQSEVTVLLGARVGRVRPGAGSTLTVEFTDSDGEHSASADRVYNCTYSQINQILSDSELPLIRLRHELTEMPLLEVPNELRSLGITVVCGPFFSLMPFPPRGIHSLHHVRYTPHCSWSDGDVLNRDSHRFFREHARASGFRTMIKDATRYLPIIGDSRYVDSLWEIKTILPLSDLDDSRPILFKRDHGLPNLTCILGGKLDNIFDVLDEVEDRL